ncbi:hypothetical protein CPB85DRAFT_434218 [Mucidula mucida]|nr:hypothetical protein CPB85DRAFT_434218 [Mucidula mucida]
MAPFSNPSTVLKQADGLVSVGQPHAALQSLSDLFASKRFRSTPLPMLEPIMIRFVELCVETRRGRQAKEGLMQYKNIAQNVDTSSVERVVQRLVSEASRRVQEAVDKAAQVTAAASASTGVEVEDLEASETPESILLGAVSGDQNKDRTDRALVTPWLKFLWEAYRTSLETLKNNARLEGIYQQIAQSAFTFCLAYNRRVEFRRLCETLRLHLSNVAKYSHQPHAINLSDPETLQHHLDTRFAQLATSVKLELWQEAFRSVEDVHMLLTMAKAFGPNKGVSARPAMMAGYYEKCTKVFLMNGAGGAGALWHAAAWGRYYAIVTSMPESAKEVANLAGQVLVSALAVPVNTNLEYEPGESGGKGKTARLTALLGLSKPPTRASLLKDAKAADVLRLSPPTVQKLYDVLEVQFEPLTLSADVAPLLAELESEEVYKDYVPLLREAVLSRLLLQLSEVYSTMRLKDLLELVTPLGAEWSQGRVESYVMGCARRGELNVRLDHLQGSVEFVDDGFGKVNEDQVGARESGVQPSVGELVRKRLGSVAVCLHNTLAMLEPAPESDKDAEKLDALVKAVNAERHALSLRRALVARRRELNSELSVRKEKEESSRLAEIARRKKEEEGRREKEMARAREVERVKKERENIQRVEAEKYAQSLLKVGTLKEKDLEKLDKFDTENLLSMQVQQLEKEKKETSLRLRVIAKRVDHLERAYRKEEAPLLAQDYSRQQLQDRTTHEGLQTQRKAASLTHHKEEIQTKERMKRMVEDYEKRRAELVRKRGEEFARKQDEATRKCEEEKNKRRKAIEKKKDDERKAREEEERRRRQAEEEERRLEEERAAEEEQLRLEEERIQKEAEAVKAAEEEKTRKAREEREADRAAAAEKARLQREREEEAERRAAERRKGATAAPPSRGGFASSTNGGAMRGVAPVRRSPLCRRHPSERACSRLVPRVLLPASTVLALLAVVAGGSGRRLVRRVALLLLLHPPRSETPVQKKEEKPAEDDGFQTVQKPGVWRPRRGGRP